jgi:hypothetical protein
MLNGSNPVKLGGRPPGRRNSYLHTKASPGTCTAAAHSRSWPRQRGSASSTLNLEPRDIQIETVVTELSDEELVSMIQNLRTQIPQQQQMAMLTNGRVLDAKSRRIS